MSDVRTFDSRRGGVLQSPSGDAYGDGIRLTPEELRKGFPAKFNKPILEACWLLLRPFNPKMLIDPFAGIGGAEGLRTFGYCGNLTGIEIEEEWADLNPWVYHADSTDMPFPDGMFDGAISSPTYGNRMADQFKASEWRRRNTYMHKLGRRLSKNNTGGYYFGSKQYFDLHDAVLDELHRILEPLSPVAWNTKNSVPGGKLQQVTQWHRDAFQRHGFLYMRTMSIPVRGNGYGANRDIRVPYESVDLFLKQVTR